MIPLTCRPDVFVTHTDDDGVEYKFRPKSGVLEAEYFEFVGRLESMTIAEYVAQEKAFVDKILISVNPKGKFTMPDGAFSKIYNAKERKTIIDYWFIANTLTDEEKKSS